MKRVLKRWVLVLSAGYVFVFFSELAFWGTYDPVGMAPVQFGLTWFGYSLLAGVFLVIIHRSRVSTVWPLFLAGSVYGWMVEGVVGHTLYGTPEFPFPITLSWTGLAWHALISVLIGWHLVKRTQLENDCWKTVRLSASSAAPTGSGRLLVVRAGTSRDGLGPGRAKGHRAGPLGPLCHRDHAAVDRELLGRRPHPSPSLSGQSGGDVVPRGHHHPVLRGRHPAPDFRGGFRPAPLTALAYLALRRHRKTEPQAGLASVLRGRVRGLNYACLLWIPAVASLCYGPALAVDWRFPTNGVVYSASAILGAGMFVLSLVKVLRWRRPVVGAP